jgi:hypothetical protein
MGRVQDHRAAPSQAAAIARTSGYCHPRRDAAERRHDHADGPEDLEQPIIRIRDMGMVSTQPIIGRS